VEPSLSLPEIADVAYGDGPVVVLVLTSSPAAVNFSSSDPSVATITQTGEDSAQISIVGAGTTVISATQSATTGFAAASASTSFTVAKAQQTALSVTTLIGFPGTPITLASTGGSVVGSTTYSLSANSADCTLNGDQLTRATTGTCQITATKAGDANYLDVSTTATVSFVAVLHGDVSEGQSLTLTAPSGMKFASVVFASYGTPTGTGGNYVQGQCHASNSLTIVSNSALGQTAVTLQASNGIFGDPCGGTVKRLAVSLGLSPIVDHLLMYEVASPTRDSNAIVYQQGFGIGSSDAAATFDAQGRTIQRIFYRMEVQVGPSLRFAEVSFDSWAGLTAGALRVPDLSSDANKFVLQRFVENMTVSSNMTLDVMTDTEKSASSGIVTGSGRRGYLEIWPWNYGPEPTNGGPTGSDPTGNRYDFNDTHHGGSGYGSFQVHDVTTAGTGSTIFAWNNHGSAHPDIGLGSRMTADPDWTFAGGVGLGHVNWRLQISVETSPYVPLTATGGIVEDVVIDSITYRMHTFTTVGSDTFTVTDPGTNGEIDYLVVGGGGGGGRSGPAGAGGGGGGGEVHTGNLTLVSGSFQVMVGAGGEGVANTAPNHVTGGMGGDSGFDTVVAWGGGGGGGGNGVAAATRATGGGAGATSAALMTGAAGTDGRGFRGGDSLAARGGGGGGAGGTGVTAPSGGGGGGGAGASVNISGQGVAFGGGGGGGCQITGCVAGAGADGGGAGGGVSAIGLPGTPNTGGGGGGAGGHSSSGGSGNGGSGIVIIRYRLTPPEV